MSVPMPHDPRLPLPERTGDDAVDEAMTALDETPVEDLDGTIAAAETLHRVLGERLGDLGRG